jgi:hypothetical protein
VHKRAWRGRKVSGRKALNVGKWDWPTSESGKPTIDEKFPTFRGPRSGGMVGWWDGKPKIKIVGKLSSFFRRIHGDTTSARMQSALLVSSQRRAISAYNRVALHYPQERRGQQIHLRHQQSAPILNLHSAGRKPPVTLRTVHAPSVLPVLAGMHARTQP